MQHVGSTSDKRHRLKLRLDRTAKELQAGELSPESQPLADALLYIASQPDGALTNDLLAYLWEATGVMTSRAYLYHILVTLRKRCHIYTLDMSKPGLARNFIEGEGRDAARPLPEEKKS